MGTWMTDEELREDPKAEFYPGERDKNHLLVSNGRCCGCPDETMESKHAICKCLCHEHTSKEWCNLCNYWHYYDDDYSKHGSVKLYDDSFLAMIFRGDVKSNKDPKGG